MVLHITGQITKETHSTQKDLGINIRVISFSLFENVAQPGDLKYFLGGVENVHLQKKYYPDWICRFYVDRSVPLTITDQLHNLGAEVVFKDGPKDFTRLFWRFECFKDKSIERFIVRDADSRLNPREADAVDEWIKSEKDFHIIRDNAQHNARILGGLFGVASSLIAKMAEQYDDMLKEHFCSKPHIKLEHHHRGPFFDSDQTFLNRYVWRMVEDSHLAHIKDLENLRFTGKEKLLKVDLPDGKFCGQMVSNYILSDLRENPPSIICNRDLPMLELARPGDILVTRNTDAVGNDNPGYWNHSAVMAYGGYVIEAQPDPAAVIAVPYESFEQRYPEIFVFNVDGDGDRIAQEAVKLLGLPYRRLASVFPRGRRPALGENCVSVVRKAVGKALGRDPRWRRPDQVVEDAREEIGRKKDYENWVAPDDRFAGMTKDKSEVLACRGRQL
jgi:hypothetical protein